MKLETKWAGSWNGKSEFETGSSPPRWISIPLPVNRADLDGLTKFLTRGTRRPGQALTTIHFVEPNEISACADEVTFLIYGTNVWRSAEVFLGGLQSQEVKVLPDMEGISAKFNLDNFYKLQNEQQNPLGYEEVVLRINTRNGKDWRPIRISGHRNSYAEPSEKDGEKKLKDGEKKLLRTCTAPYSVPTPIVRHRLSPAPAIYALAPLKIPSCADTVRVVIAGRDILSSVPEQSTTATARVPPEVFLGGVKGEVQIHGGDETAPLQVISASFSSMPRAAGPLPLIMINRGGFTTAYIDVSQCRLEEANSFPPSRAAGHPATGNKPD